jgi:hypothetical protein
VVELMTNRWNRKKRRRRSEGPRLFGREELEGVAQELATEGPDFNRMGRGYLAGADLTPELIARLVHDEGYAASDLQTFAELGYRWNRETRSMWLPPALGALDREYPEGQLLTSEIAAELAGAWGWPAEQLQELVPLGLRWRQEQREFVSPAEMAALAGDAPPPAPPCARAKNSQH